MIKDDLRTARKALESAARGFDPSACSGQDAIDLVEEIGRVRRLKRGHALPGETCEIPGVGPVSVDWVREMLGDAFVTAVLQKGKNITTVAHLGRHIPAELRTAMLVSGRECSIDGCTGREYLELDHCEIDHAKNGPTAWWNLTWLCSPHHTRKTQGWTLGPPDPTTRKRKLTPPRASHAA